jgi:hypothetical protein
LRLITVRDSSIESYFFGLRLRTLGPKRLGRLATPVIGIERLNTEVDVRNPRQALTPAEVEQVLESARNSRHWVQGISGK